MHRLSAIAKHVEKKGGALGGPGKRALSVAGQLATQVAAPSLLTRGRKMTSCIQYPYCATMHAAFEGTIQ